MYMLRSHSMPAEWHLHVSASLPLWAIPMDDHLHAWQTLHRDRHHVRPDTDVLYTADHGRI